MKNHILTLQPSDVLFFKDGRPMEGAASGHGAAWPLPNVLDSAIHHALRRAGLENIHKHRPARSGKHLSANRKEHGREFGSLQTAGPFPVIDGKWFFPRPADADRVSSATTTHKPFQNKIAGAVNSLKNKLCPVVNTLSPEKEKAEPWISADGFAAYLNGKELTGDGHFLNDDDIFAAENNIGIAIDPDSDTAKEGAFYSASYLRLKEEVRLGLLAACMDKGEHGKEANLDLIADTFKNSGEETRILVGGQQRIGSVTRTCPEKLPFPLGASISGNLVRWTLLTPAIFPELAKTHQHPGGWLPSWICPDRFTVQLKATEDAKRHEGEGRKSWRKRVAALSAIKAKLVAASISRAIPVTGWALRDTNDETAAFDAPGGARATHLAVPAGAVYYFEADSETEAQKLATALNWHGNTAGTEIVNRRSTIFGEKGFGLGVCSTWQPYQSS